VFPTKLKILPQFIFNSRDPIVMGVNVEAGVLRQGTPLCVPSKGVSVCICRVQYVFVGPVSIFVGRRNRCNNII
jgi:translation initiation factor IF-2